MRFRLSLGSRRALDPGVGLVALRGAVAVLVLAGLARPGWALVPPSSAPEAARPAGAAAAARAAVTEIPVPRLLGPGASIAPYEARRPAGGFRPFAVVP